MYKVDVYTGIEKYSGTDANVYMTIYGTRGDTGKRKLLKSDNKDKFDEGQVCKQNSIFLVILISCVLLYVVVVVVIP